MHSLIYIAVTNIWLLPDFPRYIYIYIKTVNKSIYNITLKMNFGSDEITKI